MKVIIESAVCPDCKQSTAISCPCKDEWNKWKNRKVTKLKIPCVWILRPGVDDVIYMDSKNRCGKPATKKVTNWPTDDWWFCEKHYRRSRGLS